MGYANSVCLNMPFEDAVVLGKEKLQEQGFGVLTEIDLQSTFREKLAHDIEPYLILGACNPSLAHRALDIDDEVGLLLPCNVVVQARDGTTVVRALDPQVLVKVSDKDLQPVADEAALRLRSVLAALGSVDRSLSPS